MRVTTPCCLASLSWATGEAADLLAALANFSFLIAECLMLFSLHILVHESLYDVTGDFRGTTMSNAHRCMACDRPLDKLDDKAGPYIPTHQLPVSVAAAPDVNTKVCCILFCSHKFIIFAVQVSITNASSHNLNICLTCS